MLLLGVHLLVRQQALAVGDLQNRQMEDIVKKQATVTSFLTSLGSDLILKSEKL